MDYGQIFGRFDRDLIRHPRDEVPTDFVVGVQHDLRDHPELVRQSMDFLNPHKVIRRRRVKLDLDRPRRRWFLRPHANACDSDGQHKKHENPHASCLLDLLCISGKIRRKQPKKEAGTRKGAA